MAENQRRHLGEGELTLDAAPPVEEGSLEHPLSDQDLGL